MNLLTNLRKLLFSRIEDSVPLMECSNFWDSSYRSVLCSMYNFIGQMGYSHIIDNSASSVSIQWTA